MVILFNIFHEKLDSIQYNVCLAITGALRGTSKEKIYKELGLESLQFWSWYKKLGMFYKIPKNKSPQYLFKRTREKTYAYATRNIDITTYFKIRHNVFKKSFFPSLIIEWNNLGPTLWNSKSFVVFKNSVLKFIRPSPNNVFSYDNHKVIRLITWLHIGINCLCEHKFKNSFQGCWNPICSCGLDIESTSHFLLHCATFSDEWYSLLSTLNKIDCELLEWANSSLLQTLCYITSLFNNFFVIWQHIFRERKKYTNS